MEIMKFINIDNCMLKNSLERKSVIHYTLMCKISVDLLNTEGYYSS